METQQAGTGRQRRARVTEENRKRAVRACDACRQQKEKCQGGVPCLRCIKYRRPCEFNMLSKPRLPIQINSAYGSNIHAELEAEREKNRYMESIISHFVGSTTSFDLESLRQLTESLHIEPSSRQDSFSEADMQELESHTIDDEKFTVRPLTDSTTHYSGEFSHWTFGERIQRRINEWAQEADSEEPSGVEQIKEFWRATKLQSPANVVPEIVACFPPPQVAHFLIQTFFKFCETNYYFVDDVWLYEKLELCYSHPDTLRNDDAATICVIVAIFAVGTQYAHIHAESPNDSSREEELLENQSIAEEDIGLTFYRLACKLVPDVITLASLESVQAFLLMGVYTLPLDAHGLSYTYLGISMKMAIQNGMHRKYSGGGLDARRVELRNRLWWSTYALEKRISILHGRPTSVSLMDVDADLPKDLPELRPLDGSVSTFANRTAMITLTVRLGDIAEQISLLRRCPRRRHAEHLERLLILRKRLLEWWSSLPEETYCKDLRPQGPLFRRNIHLKLNYHLAQIFMGRCFIFQPIRGASASPTDEAAKQAHSSHKSLLVNDCIQSALEIINLCQLLQREMGLARASYTEFSSCRAAMLAILAQSLNEQSEQLRTALTQGMRLMRLMAVGIDSAKSEVSIIEALERALRRLDAREKSSSSGTPQMGSSSTPSGYETFRNWATLWRSGPSDFGTGTGAGRGGRSISGSASGSRSGSIGQGAGAGAGAGAGIRSASGVTTSTTSPTLSSATGSRSDAAGSANPARVHQPLYPPSFSPGVAAASSESQNPNTQTSTPTMDPNSLDMMDFTSFTTDVPNLADFGFDHFLAPFPQELSQFSLISDFDPHLQQPQHRLSTSSPPESQTQQQYPSNDLPE